MRKKWLLLIPVLLIVLYLLGPSPATPVYNKNMPAVPAEPAALEAYIHDNEAVHKLKPDNEARIVWVNDSLKQKTDYALVYLHGFSASQGEGDPVHRYIAHKFGMNLYLARLAEHGIDTVDAMVNLTADNYWESAKQALAIGQQLGKKVILMGTSTGGTFALQLAAAYPDAVSALVLMSPNIAINNPAAWLLNNPWGLQIARGVMGSKYYGKPDTSALGRQYWCMPYRLEALVQLQEMLETEMVPATFRSVRQPTLLLYYYKDDQHQDPTVKVSAEKEMFNELGTPASLKRSVDIPNAGAHVIGSYITSHDVPSVVRAVDSFAQDILLLPQK